MMTNAGKTDADRAARQRYGTPGWLVRGLEVVSHTRIVLDVCAEAWSAKAPAWYGPGSPFGEDGLAADWRVEMIRASRRDAINTFAWCNPPYNDIEPWAERALEFASKGFPSWLHVPFRSDEPWCRTLLQEGAQLTVITKPRFNYLRPPDIPETKQTSPMGIPVFFQVGGAARLAWGINASTLGRRGLEAIRQRGAA